MSFSELSTDVLYNSNGKVMVGCGCKNLHDVVLFIREKKIEYVELAWADEMGLWHHETVPVSELTFATLQEGVPCKDGKFLVPDPLSARIAPRSQPNVMHFTCMPPTSRASLKTKHLNPEWIEMISKKLMENDKRPSIPLDKNYVGELFADASSSPPSRHMYYAKRNLSVPVPSSPYGSPNSPGCVSSPGSSPGTPLRSPIGSPGNDNPSTPSLPSLSLHYHHGPHTPHAPLTPHTPSPPASNGSFIEWKIVRNDPYGNPPTLILPPSPPSDASFTPPGSVPSSPCLPGSPHSPVPDNQEDGLSEPKSKRSKQTPHVPPLLRPRQVHPTKAHKLGITKPVKKRRNTEHLYCRHCGTTETPEWRRGPDGRKSLCNACGLYFSKMIKRETMVVPQGRRVAIDALLNPHS